MPAPAEVSATDNCSIGLQVTFNEARTDGSCPQNYTLTRTWTAIDACGNAAVATQLVTVADASVPTLGAAPADATVECDAVPAPATLGAQDNCDDTIAVVFAETRIDQTNGAYQLIRVWTASDSCSNSTSATQTVSVVDTTIPAISGTPTNATVECDAVPSPAELTATDNCDSGLTLQFEESRQDGNCSGRYTLIRVWTATDAAGNSTGLTQVVTVEDTTPPEITDGPPDQNFNSTNEVPAADTALINAADHCGTVLVIHLGDVTTGGSGTIRDPLIIERTYAAGDDCGNFTNYVQTINVSGVQALDPIVITDIASVIVD